MSSPVVRRDQSCYLLAQRAISMLAVAWQRVVSSSRISIAMAARWTFLFSLWCMIVFKAFGQMKRQKIRAHRQDEKQF